ncbi:hypothetical protein MLD38_027904 [Melastoma candidum]|uniref:Uncharacterized protein n=1 Tax=Melastoma candidum TaxID=119954 RepID=A0ACB9N0Q4_9MYRT|nr:hypothetical protein MLD38_027904 [Melastoma candidum]
MAGGHAGPLILFEFVLLVFVSLQRAKVGAGSSRNGRWEVLLNSTGVVPMHMALTRFDTVLMFDQTGAGPSQYRLRRRFSGGPCTRSHHDLEDASCYAHSVEYDVTKNRVRPLRLESDPWCSSGSILSNGTLLHVGGYGNGFREVRYFRPCHDHQCDWRQSKAHLAERRWYSSAQLLPEHDRIIIVGGRMALSYEFVPKMSSTDRTHDLPLLHRTYDAGAGGNNLYPFIHLSSDGGSRSYPSSGSSVILPLEHSNRYEKVEVMICGGAATGAYPMAGKGSYLQGLKSCGRLEITGSNHRWKMENMPGPRLLNDMIILPTGNILIINGAHKGSAGYTNAANPALQPYLYKPKKTLGRRFSVLKSTKIARLYHSSSILLPNGRILVAGGNPNFNYTFSHVKHPTELRLEAFIPHYMDRQYHDYRPMNLSVHLGSKENIARYGEDFSMRFHLGRRPSNDIKFTLYSPPFTTHSLSMNQRMLVLRCKSLVREGKGLVTATVEAPPSPKVAPSGYYMLTVVNGGIPSFSKWVRITHA